MLKSHFNKQRVFLTIIFLSSPNLLYFCIVKTNIPSAMDRKRFIYKTEKIGKTFFTLSKCYSTTNNPRRLPPP